MSQYSASSTLAAGRAAPVGDNRRAALSYTRLHTYDTCAMQYRYHYLEGYRLKFEKAVLAFGTAIHAALAAHFRTACDPVARFRQEWNRYKAQPLMYDRGESWLRFQAKGLALLRKFMTEERQRITRVWAVEKRFEVSITGLPWPIIGVADLIADVDGQLTVVDFKTAGQHYAAWDAELSDQLSTYLLAEPQAQQVAFCVFLKTKAPEIQWCFGRRAPRDFTAYLDKIAYIAEDIESKRFFKRSGRHCGWCDYRPLCLGNTRRAAETLVQITPDAHRSEAEEVDA